MALHLPINEQCNIQCVFCSSAGRGGRFDVDSLLAQINKDKTGHVQVSGGDPLIREPADLLKILVHCRKLGKIVELQTNAVTIARYHPRRMKLIAGLVDFFNVNFSAHTPELDLAVTGTPGAFESRIRGIHALHALGARVRLNYIVHGLNFRQTRDFVDFAVKELGTFSWIQFSYVKGMGRAAGSANVIPRFREAAPHLNAAMARCRELGIDFQVDHIPVCFVRDFKDRHADYLKMLESKPGAHLSEKQQVAECDGCSLREMCPGPRKDYIELYGAL